MIKKKTRRNNGHVDVLTVCLAEKRRWNSFTRGSSTQNAMPSPRPPRHTAAVVALLLSVCASPATSLQCGSDGGDEINFELLTGYAASPAAKHAMREQLALFTLPQCIAACKSDDQCAAVTFETGACVSYSAVPQKNANSGMVQPLQYHNDAG